MNLKKTKVDDSSGFNSHVEKFCLGVSSLWSVAWMHLMLRLCYFYYIVLHRCTIEMELWEMGLGQASTRFTYGCGITIISQNILVDKA
jgi:hypothetical protein